jgi:hypothetical protein
MKRFQIVVVIVAALGVVTVLFFSMSPYALRDVTLSLSLGSKPRAMVESMGVPDGAYGVSKISVSGPDGPMPEIATRSFEIRSSAAALEQFFSTKCKKSGLGPPDAEDLRLEPDLLCRTRAPGVVESFYLTARCPSGVCRVTVEAQRLTH